MAVSSCLLTIPAISSSTVPSSIPSTSFNPAIPSADRQHKSQGRVISRIGSIRCGALKSNPKGFGEPPSSSSSSTKKNDDYSSSSPASKAPSSVQSSRQEEDDDTVPEVVTNRMLRRMLFTVGVPLGVGFLAFPAFYFARALLKMEFPQVMPTITSFVLFGLSGFGIFYAVVSTSWDPFREGSLLGWDEARVNWDLVWQKREEDDD